LAPCAGKKKTSGSYFLRREGQSKAKIKKIRTTPNRVSLTLGQKSIGRMSLNQYVIITLFDKNVRTCKIIIN
jgi:hypothetical protein